MSYLRVLVSDVQGTQDLHRQATDLGQVTHSLDNRSEGRAKGKTQFKEKGDLMHILKQPSLPSTDMKPTYRSGREADLEETGLLYPHLQED